MLLLTNTSLHFEMWRMKKEKVIIRCSKTHPRLMMSLWNFGFPAIVKFTLSKKMTGWFYSNDDGKSKRLAFGNQMVELLSSFKQTFFMLNYQIALVFNLVCRCFSQIHKLKINQALTHLWNMWMLDRMRGRARASEDRGSTEDRLIYGTSFTLLAWFRSAQSPRVRSSSIPKY